MANDSKLPKYFGAEFLKTTLDEGLERTDVKVLNYDIKLASFAGENYCSDIYRVKVNYVYENENSTMPKEIHLILKDMKSEVEQSMPKSKETAMYKDVVPELEKIIGGNEVLAPKLFIATKYESEVYVFQDLNALGYELKDRINGLNEADCIALLKKIGKFHAASIVYAEKHPEVIDEIKKHMFQCGTKHNDLLDSHMAGMLRSASEAIEGWEGYESVAKKLRKLSTVFHEKTIETLNRSDFRYKVINHGDLWVNNFLFKDDDVAFIDLQLASYGSPAIDINYFLYSSVPVDILKTKRYEFLRIYFKQFQETLKSVDYKNIPSWEDFLHEMRRMEFSGIWTLITVFPMVTLNKENAVGTDIALIKDENAFEAKKKLIFCTKRTQDTLKYALDRFNDVGALDL